MTDTDTRTIVTEPCVIPDMDDATYHADPVPAGSLSSTGARRILDSPARFRWERTHRVEKTAFDVGHLVHSMVLGTGMPVAVIPEGILASNGAASTKDAKDFIAAARAGGKVPMKADDLAPLRAMADAVLTHQIASAILEHPGVPESSAFARDPETGTWLRARPDYLEDPHAGRTILADLKTSRTANPAAFGKSVAEFGYHQQDDLYRAVVRLARGDDDTAFVFIVVEVDPPHLVSVIELDPTAKRIGAERNRRAIDLYTRCQATGSWPGYPVEVTQVSLPKWAEYAHDDFLETAS